MNYHNFPVEVTCLSEYLADGYYAVPESCELGDDEATVEGDAIPEGWVLLDTDDRDDACRVLAMRLHKGDFTEPVVGANGRCVAFGNEDWLVMTDGEADRLDDDMIQQQLDDEMENVSTTLSCCVDTEKFIRLVNIDHRANRLGRCDGIEHAVELADQSYYLYRQN